MWRVLAGSIVTCLVHLEQDHHVAHVYDPEEEMGCEHKKLETVKSVGFRGHADEVVVGSSKVADRQEISLVQPAMCSLGKLQMN